jgi:hypothetical protein
MRSFVLRLFGKLGDAFVQQAAQSFQKLDARIAEVFDGGVPEAALE